MKLIMIIFFYIPLVFASSIKDYDYYDYQVYFTNPECALYQYDKPIYSFKGELLVSKPKNVYCKKAEQFKNEKMKKSPHYNIKKLIVDKNINELKMAYLSFSNNDILKTLCEITIGENNTKLTIFVDIGSKKSKSKFKKMKKLMDCQPAQSYIDAGVANYPRIEFRGQTSGLGYAHNKIIMANYRTLPNKVTIVFSSGNMSSGTSLHHENWHFLTTSTKTYFSQVHSCIIEGMDNHAKSIRGNRSLNRSAQSAMDNFKSFIKTCRSAINTPEEDDIKVFIIPSDGKEAMDNIVKNIKQAQNISVAVHRFSNPNLIKALKEAGRDKNKNVSFIADDDIFWAGKKNELPNGRIECSRSRNPLAISRVGANMCNEYFKVRSLKYSGVNIKYMETNQSIFQLHHNKYILFTFKNAKAALHCGAGNFTKAAFSKNFENFYFIKIPEVTEKFKQQYSYMWNDLATKEEDLPMTESSL